MSLVKFMMNSLIAPVKIENMNAGPTLSGDVVLQK
ncbi:hypothetical protein SAMN04488696_1836 [Methanolobus profundi]|uniref:Uncharacterized protein n=1 Tax=Methanolobus profundi TaxID=487685 RepID=A0A1I4S8Z4_9EURY|nr:hypothetical protein SAMN04488696_1836 [Methanolobus profundi]